LRGAGLFRIRFTLADFLCLLTWLAGRQFAFTGLQSVPGIEPASVSAEDGNRKVFESREPGILDKSPLEMSNPGILAK
jgi:hypothetical protein